MNPKQIAATECANWWKSGACLGPQQEHDVCLVVAGERCGYFEQCVLPIEHMTTDDRKRMAIAKAAAEYKATTEGPPRLCRCGKEREKGKKYCPDCRQNARKKTWREHKRRTGV